MQASSSSSHYLRPFDPDVLSEPDSECFPDLDPSSDGESLPPDVESLPDDIESLPDVETCESCCK